MWIRTYLVLLIFALSFMDLNAQQPFITTWQTDNPGTSQDNELTIPGTGFEYLIEWEEVDNPANKGSQTANNGHTLILPSPGTYRVAISGDFERIHFKSSIWGSDKLKFLSIEQWGDIKWASMAGAFQGCENLTYTATDVPDLSAVKSSAFMFEDCIVFNGNISEWDVSSITNMRGMFERALSFNQPIGDWDVSKVENMTTMFSGAQTFNQPLGDWDVSSVKEIRLMFSFAFSFNQPLGDWDVSNIHNMQEIFAMATSFNQPLGDWDVSNVRFMWGLFHGAESFNQPLDKWDVGSVVNMFSMFTGATSFDQNLSMWDLSSIIKLGNNLFNNSGMSCENYDLTLTGWSDNPSTPDNLTLGAVGIQYWQAVDAREKLIEEKGWTIIGDVRRSCDPEVCDPRDPTIDVLGPVLLCTGDSTILRTNISAPSYKWFNDGQLLSGEDYRQLRVYQSGNYTVRYTDEVGCESDLSEAVEIELSGQSLAMTNARDTILRSGVPICEGFALFDAVILTCEGDMKEIRDRSLWRLDLHNTGQFDIISTQPRPDGSERDNLRIEEELPFGTHRVQWQIRDEHGNVVIEEQLLTLVDMNPPTPVCLHGIAASIHPSSGEITLPAWVYDAGSWDDCTDSEDLIFTFSSDLSHTHHTWTCDDLNGLSEKTLEVEIWVTNKYGHQNHCVTYIKIQENQESCPDTAGVTIVVSGQVSNPATIPLEGVVIEVDNHFQTYYLSGNTNGEGRFELNVPIEEELLLRGHYSGYPLNGVSTFDIALIQRHILGIQALDSPYDRIAADVNDDGNIDLLDIAQLQKLILGKYTDFPDNNSWKVIVNEALDDSREVPAHRRVFELEGALRGLPDNDFIGIKIGDVNASHRLKGMPSEERSLRETFNINVHNRTVKGGDLVEVVLSAERATELTGYQGTIQFEWERLEFVNYESGRIDLTDAHFGFHRLDEGQITTSWSTPDPIDIKRGERLWTLYFEAKEEGRLSDLLALTSAITPAEAYTNLGTENLAIVFEGMEKDTEELVLHGNRPNPFHRQATINYSLPEPARVAITIFNSMGHEVKVMEKDQSAGHHEYPIHSSELGSSGVYIYRIDTSGQTRTGKLVLIK